MSKKQTKYKIIEILVWSTVIITTIFAVTRNWNEAEKMINYIAYASAVFAIYYYLRNRSLYSESNQKTLELTREKRELSARQKTIDLIFQNSADGILVLDYEKRIEEFSPGMERITGFTKEEAVGRLATDLLKFHTSGTSSILPDLMFSVSNINKNNPYIKNSLTTKIGKNVDFEASFAIINNQKSDKIKSMAILRDITYEKALAERDKEFIAITSHQLNTPLSIIRGYSSMLIAGKAGAITEKQKQYLNEIHKSCQKMVTLTSDLLSISRIEQDQIKLDFVDVNLPDLIAEIIKNLNETINASTLKVSVAINQKNLIISADVVKLTQALTNIIDNAIKYTKKGSVCISVCDQDKYAIITIKDTGEGIPKDQIEKIGQRFFRTQEAINANTKGTGLGVYIAKSIVLKHHGKFEIKSEINKGTEIKIAIPKSTVDFGVQLPAMPN